MKLSQCMHCEVRDLASRNSRGNPMDNALECDAKSEFDMPIDAVLSCAANDEHFALYALCCHVLYAGRKAHPKSSWSIRKTRVSPFCPLAHQTFEFQAGQSSSNCSQPCFTCSHLSRSVSPASSSAQVAHSSTLARLQKAQQAFLKYRRHCLQVFLSSSDYLP